MPAAAARLTAVCYCGLQGAMSGAALLLKGSIIPDVAEPEVRVCSYHHPR